MNINIEEILKKHESFFNHEEFIPPIKDAIKEIVEAVIDKCAEEAKTKDLSKMPYEEDMVVDEKSILNVKKMINYE